MLKWLLRMIAGVAILIALSVLAPLPISREPAVPLRRLRHQQRRR